MNHSQPWDHWFVISSEVANPEPQSPVQSRYRATPPTIPTPTHHASSLHSFRESPCMGLAPEGCALEALMAQVSNEAKGVWVTANANKSHKAHRALPQWLLLCTSLCLPTPGLVTRGPGTGWTHQALPAATTSRHPCPPFSFQFHLLVPEWDVQS